MQNGAGDRAGSPGHWSEWPGCQFSHGFIEIQVYILDRTGLKPWSGSTCSDRAVLSWSENIGKRMELVHQLSQ